MERYSWITLAVMTSACSSAGGEAVSMGTHTEGIELTTGTGASDSHGSFTGGGGEEGKGEAGTGSTSGGLPKLDVGPSANNDSFCATHAAGFHCDGATAIECGSDGETASETLCTPGFCVPGEGCVVCLAGQYSCLGDRVLQCDEAADPPQWQEIATCDPSLNQTCNGATGECVEASPIGFPCTNDSECATGQHCAVDPGQCVTGKYYKFASFSQADGTLNHGAYDVDSWGNRLYVTRVVFSADIDVYEVELLDSDNDGQVEPDQHPDNPDNPGPIEERVLSFVETCSPTSTTCPMPLTHIAPSSTELYIDSSNIYTAGVGVTAYPLAGGPATVVTNPPQFGEPHISHLGFDDISGTWYGSSERGRRVYQYNANTGTWGIAFDYPALAGSHMDGMEVVVQPGTNVAYVYVSDMTSDFIGQYHLDPEQGWVQDNLFEYQDDANVLVEGMGFGALNHFWAAGGNELYEIGGGDITMFVEPPPPPE